MPVPGVMVSLSPEFNPAMLKGVTIHPENPFKFDFILDKGDEYNRHPERSEGSLKEQLKVESSKLVKYFLSAITTPEKDLWVNLSPYEKDRVIPESFGQTGMGRDLLAEDYILKQVTASLIYPEGEIGKRFWKRIYEEAQKKFGTTNIPVNTFNKVWIVPDHAKVYEHGNTAFVVKASLKVMLEEDYLSMSKHQGQPAMGTDTNSALRPILGQELVSVPSNGVNALGSQIVRQIVIPELEKEVNEGKNFAGLRQVYHSLILAVWFKKRMKESLLGRKYMDQNKVSNLSSPNSSVGDPNMIYQRYLKAFKKGVYNYIKEEPDSSTQEMIPKKYFSGGFGDVAMFVAHRIDYTQTISSDEAQISDGAMLTVNLSSQAPVTVPVVKKPAKSLVFNTIKGLLLAALVAFQPNANAKLVLGDSVTDAKMREALVPAVESTRMILTWPVQSQDPEIIRLVQSAQRLIGGDSVTYKLEIVDLQEYIRRLRGLKDDTTYSGRMSQAGDARSIVTKIDDSNYEIFYDVKNLKMGMAGMVAGLAHEIIAHSNVNENGLNDWEIEHEAFRLELKFLDAILADPGFQAQMKGSGETIIEEIKGLMQEDTQALNYTQMKIDEQKQASVKHSSGWVAATIGVIVLAGGIIALRIKLTSAKSKKLSSVKIPNKGFKKKKGSKSKDNSQLSQASKTDQAATAELNLETLEANKELAVLPAAFDSGKLKKEIDLGDGYYLEPVLMMPFLLQMKMGNQPTIIYKYQYKGSPLPIGQLSLEWDQRTYTWRSVGDEIYPKERTNGVDHRGKGLGTRANAQLVRIFGVLASAGVEVPITSEAAQRMWKRLGAQIENVGTDDLFKNPAGKAYILRYKKEGLEPDKAMTVKEAIDQLKGTDIPYVSEENPLGEQHLMINFIPKVMVPGAVPEFSFIDSPRYDKRVKTGYNASEVLIGIPWGKKGSRYIPGVSFKGLADFVEMKVRSHFAKGGYKEIPVGFETRFAEFKKGLERQIAQMDQAQTVDQAMITFGEYKDFLEPILQQYDHQQTLSWSDIIRQLNGENLQKAPASSLQYSKYLIPDIELSDEEKNIREAKTRFIEGDSFSAKDILGSMIKTVDSEGLLAKRVSLLLRRIESLGNKASTRRERQILILEPTASDVLTAVKALALKSKWDDEDTKLSIAVGSIWGTDNVFSESQKAQEFRILANILMSTVAVYPDIHALAEPIEDLFLRTKDPLGHLKAAIPVEIQDIASKMDDLIVDIRGYDHPGPEGNKLAEELLTKVRFINEREIINPLVIGKQVIPLVSFEDVIKQLPKEAQDVQKFWELATLPDIKDLRRLVEFNYEIGIVFNEDQRWVIYTGLKDTMPAGVLLPLFEEGKILIDIHTHPKSIGNDALARDPRNPSTLDLGFYSQFSNNSLHLSQFGITFTTRPSQNPYTLQSQYHDQSFDRNLLFWLHEKHPEEKIDSISELRNVSPKVYDEYLKALGVKKESMEWSEQVDLKKKLENLIKKAKQQSPLSKRYGNDPSARQQGINYLVARYRHILGGNFQRLDWIEGDIETAYREAKGDQENPTLEQFAAKLRSNLSQAKELIDTYNLSHPKKKGLELKDNAQTSRSADQAMAGSKQKRSEIEELLGDLRRRLYDSKVNAASLALIQRDLGKLSSKKGAEKYEEEIGSLADYVDSLKRFKNAGQDVNYPYRHFLYGFPRDEAMLNNKEAKGPGGIDLTAKRMNVEIDQDKSGGVAPIDLKVLENLEIRGLYIKSIEIKPLNNLLEMLGVSA